MVPSGLKGIFFSPFLHGSWEHILGNSLPLVVLSSLLYQFYGSVADRVMLYGWLFSGLTVWMTPSINLFDHQTYTSCIIGASGVIYVLAFFLFASGVIRWNLKLLTVSLIVALYYGSMIWGMIPEELLFTLSEPSRISWQSHLSGAVIGVIMAFIYKDKGEKRKNSFGNILSTTTKKMIFFGKNIFRKTRKTSENYLTEKRRYLGFLR